MQTYRSIGTRNLQILSTIEGKDVIKRFFQAIQICLILLLTAATVSAQNSFIAIGGDASSVGTRPFSCFKTFVGLLEGTTLGESSGVSVAENGPRYGQTFASYSGTTAQGASFGTTVNLAARNQGL